MKVYIGTCGNKVGLARYLELFDTLEINSTFYRFPSARSLQNWKKAFSRRPDFVLSIKAFQGFTHPLSSPTWRRAQLDPEERERLKGQVGCLQWNAVTEGFLKKTLDMLQGLSARFLLFQLPRNCEKESSRFEAFFSRLRERTSGGKDLVLGLEIRWDDPDLLEDLYRKYRVVPVFDPFLFPGYLECFRNLPLIYFRLHGSLEHGRLNYNKRYSDEELAKLAEVIKGLQSGEVFVLFNNVYMHDDALRFQNILHP